MTRVNIKPKSCDGRDQHVIEITGRSTLISELVRLGLGLLNGILDATKGCQAALKWTLNFNHLIKQSN